MPRSAPVETLTFRGIALEVSRRQTRALRLTVYPGGRVLAVIPHHAGPEELYSFLEAKFSWIEKHLNRYRERARKKPLAENDFTSGEIYYVWGIPHRLEIVERRGHPKIVCQSSPDGTGNMIMYTRPGSTKAQKQALLDKWRRQLVAETAPALAAKWQAPLASMAKKPGLGVEKIYLQKMKTHWGSCNAGRRTIRLNTELAAKPPEYLDYVVLHEMVHLVVSAHNERFYRYMNALLPQWKTIRREMNKNEG
jgi:predicted metal-dependent hydrolase